MQARKERRSDHRVADELGVAQAGEAFVRQADKWAASVGRVCASLDRAAFASRSIDRS